MNKLIELAASVSHVIHALKPTLLDVAMFAIMAIELGKILIGIIAG